MTLPHYNDFVLGIKSRPMSNQEAFDNAWHYFVTENHPLAQDPSGQCFYRHPEKPTACAIGCQVPRPLIDALAQYNPAANELLADFPMFSDYFSHVTGTLLEELQAVHDASESTLVYACEMRRLAAAWGLKVPDA